MATEESNLAAKISMNDSTFKALVADDSAVYRKLVQRTLSTELSSIFYATTGEEAVRIFDMEHPSMVITDWVMPDLTGQLFTSAALMLSHAGFTLAPLRTVDTHIPALTSSTAPATARSISMIPASAAAPARATAPMA